LSVWGVGGGLYLTKHRLPSFSNLCMARVMSPQEGPEQAWVVCTHVCVQHPLTWCLQQRAECGINRGDKGSKQRLGSPVASGAEPAVAHTMALQPHSSSSSSPIGSSGHWRSGQGALLEHEVSIRMRGPPDGDVVHSCVRQVLFTFLGLCCAYILGLCCAKSNYTRF
jgi:hypothetical protein